MTMNLISRIAAVFVRLLIFIPAYSVVATVLDDLLGHPGYAWRQPSFFWYLYGLQIVLGILCLMPYPNFLFRKAIKMFFILLILICAVHGLCRVWLPSYYASSQLKNYPEYVKSFDEAKQYPKNDGFYTSQAEHGVTLWWAQRPDYYEWQILVFQTIFCLGPLALFFIRVYQIRHGFTWKGLFDGIGKTASQERLARGEKIM